MLHSGLPRFDGQQVEGLVGEVRQRGDHRPHARAVPRFRIAQQTLPRVRQGLQRDAAGGSQPVSICFYLFHIAQSMISFCSYHFIYHFI